MREPEVALCGSEQAPKLERCRSTLQAHSKCCLTELAHFDIPSNTSFIMSVLHSMLTSNMRLDL